jgi:cyclopropane-fatty-acyl-phospholipid synthase
VGRHPLRAHCGGVAVESRRAPRDEALIVLQRAYGPDDAARWLQRWRLFLMACAELFGYGNGSECGVAHYRLARR